MYVELGVVRWGRCFLLPQTKEHQLQTILVSIDHSDMQCSVQVRQEAINYRLSA